MSRYLLFLLCYVVVFLGGMKAQPAGEGGQSVPPGGAPPPGSGPFEITGFVRVIEGDTIEAYINGNRVGIGLIGVKAPRGNSACGKLAIDFKNALAKTGLRLEEDKSLSFDSRSRRLYYVSTKDGRSVARELVKAGLAQSDGQGKEQTDIQQDEVDAKNNKRGCVWDPVANNVSATSPLNRDSISEPSVPTAKAAVSDAAISVDQVAAAPAAATSLTLINGFTQSAIASGFTNPTAFAFVPDGRILVAEKKGLVKVYKNGAVLPTPFIDIRDHVNDYWDRGLLGIAVDPAFATNGFVYLLYTYENNAADYSGTKTARLTRVTAVGDTASPTTETPILGKTVGSTCKAFPDGTDCLSSDGASHSIGNVKFAPDGTLFLTVGESGSFNVVNDEALRSQNLDLLAGKVIHITPAGNGVSTNPFWNGTASANRSKVWAYGLRNPYRLNIRPGTSTPYFGDVGWSYFEEINAAPLGGNYGWPCYEGLYRQSGYEPKPTCQSLYAQGTSAVKFGLVTWAHTGGGSAAATGGTFYTGNIFPQLFRGAYFFGDYGQGWIHYAQVDASDNLVGTPRPFISGPNSAVDIEMGPDQNLYYLDIGSAQLRSVVYNSSFDSAPSVANVSPAANATNVAASTDLIITFSEDIEPSTLTSANVFLAKQGTSTPINSVFDYDSSSFTLTVHPLASLELSAIYVATVKGGSTGIKDLTGTPMAADKAWTFTVSSTPPASTVRYLSDLPWVSMTNGWGPAERDMSNGEQAAGDGRPITVNGKQYAKGLGTHALSNIKYNLAGACTTFMADVGIDAEAGPAATVVFQVLADGTKIFDSGFMNVNGKTVAANVDLTGKNQLELNVTDGGNGTGSDHADWADAKIKCSTDTTPPTVTGTAPQSGATGVGTSSVVTATFSEPLNASTVSTSTFTLTPQGGAAPVGATVTYDVSTNIAKLVPTSALQTSTTYTAVVKGGANGVADLAGNPLALDKTWSFTTSGTAIATRYLSDMTWTSMTNGWGPVEKDMSNGEQLAGDGHPISLGGKKYTKGLGAHANSDVRFSLAGTCTTFLSDVGIDDEARPNGSVVFQVFADGTKLYDSGIVTATTAIRSVSVDVTGKNVLQLVVTDGGNGNGSDHADWADAQVACSQNSTKPVANILTPSPLLTWKFGDTISYSGSGTDSKGAALPASALSWQIILHHCSGGTCHIHPLTSSTGVASGSFSAPDHDDQPYLELVLTVTDSANQTGTASVSIQPQTVQVTVATSPTGQQVVYGGLSGTAPLTTTSIVGHNTTISANPAAGSGLSFVSWSDGGAQSHNVTIGAANTTFTATFGTSTALSVTGMAPAAGATAVPPNTAVTATFSKPLNATTVSTTTFTLAPPSGTAVAATVTYDGPSNTAKLVPASALQTGTVYKATVKGGVNGVKDTAGNALAADQTWTFTTSSTTTTTTFLSDLTWTSMTNGWGPVEKDKSNGEQAAGDGRTITINGKTYAKGLGAHAASDVRFNLGGTCTTFLSDVGVDDEVGNHGTVVFQVFADGTKLYDSGTLKGSDAAKQVNVDVTNKTVLQLVVTNAGDGNGYDHADWANAQIVCK